MHKHMNISLYIPQFLSLNLSSPVQSYLRSKNTSSRFYFERLLSFSSSSYPQRPFEDVFSQTGRVFQTSRAEKSLRKSQVRSHAGRSNFGCVEFAFSKKLTYIKVRAKEGN